MTSWDIAVRTSRDALASGAGFAVSKAARVATRRMLPRCCL
ncbi:hypothetical protein [Infirmifilum sp. NZ]|nr:hypothetical protein [Infirmifilum sp. NZ]